MASLAISASSLSEGSNPITVVYSDSGDPIYGDSTSAVMPIVVVAAAPAYRRRNSAVDDVPSQAAPSALTDGSLVLPMTAANLTYVSGSNGQPIISMDNSSGYPIESTYDSHALTGVTATLDIDGHEAVSYYSADDLTGSAGSGVYRFAVRVPTSLGTGSYSWTMTIEQTFTVGSLSHTYDSSQNQDVLNWNSSPFGQGWNLDGLDQLAIGDGIVTLVKSDGTMADFTEEATPARAPVRSRSRRLSYASETYSLKGTDGVEEQFNASGQLLDVIDHDDNITTYNWSDDKLESIDNPNGQTTSFTYTGSLVTTITDFDSRETTLGYNGSSQLTSITEPDPNNDYAADETQPVLAFGYGSTSGPLTSYVDANGNQTLYTYRPDDTLATVITADGATISYQAVQALFFGTGYYYSDGEVAGSGMPGGSTNWAYLVPNTTVRGVETDQSGSPTLYTFDTFGDTTSVEDAPANTTVSLYSIDDVDYGLVTEVVQPAVMNGGSAAYPTTYYSYYSDTNELDTEESPDGSTQTWNSYTTYDTYGGPDEQVTSYTNGLGDPPHISTIPTRPTSSRQINMPTAQAQTTAAKAPAPKTATRSRPTSTHSTQTTPRPPASSLARPIPMAS